MNHNEILPAVTEIAQLAAEAILSVYRRDFDVEQKDDDSPLTAADMAAHHVIVDRLARLTPDWPVLSEESASIDFEQRRRWSRYWLVDPLDGTREFVKRNGEFTVNIALIEDHEPVLGVVHVPVDGRCFRAAGGMASLLHSDGSEQALRCARPGAVLRIAGSRSHGSSEAAEYLQKLGEHELIARGSSLKFCEIAQGSADLYLRLGPTCEWDTAAAHCVLKAAGGEVLDLQGRPLRYNTKDSLLNPEFLAVADPQTNWLERMGLGDR